MDNPTIDAANEFGSRLSMAEDVDSLLICFSHLRWDFVFQRPQHLLSRAAAHYRVLFIEEPVHGDYPAPFLETRDRAGVAVCVPHLPLGLPADEHHLVQEKLLRSLLDRYRAEWRVAWYYTPQALEFSRFLEADVVVFDNMDELLAFHGASSHLAVLEAELLNRADIVFTGGASLFEAKKGRHGNVFSFPSSVDTAHFGQARQPHDDPGDQAGFQRPRIGFFGVVDERLDIALLADIAAMRPDWTFVMIGPVVKIDSETLPRAANIRWLGLKSYADLPAYLAGWNVAIMPFARNEATRYISPTKTPEYLAAGVRVVATSIQDVVRPYGDLGLVEIADCPHDFVAAVERALGPVSARWLEKVDRKLLTMSWDRTWVQMDAAIRQSAKAKAAQRRMVRGDALV